MEGPEPKRKTRLQYRGDRVDAERRAYKIAYARVLREAQRDARGALEDLWFLAKTLNDTEWLMGTFAETRPLQGPKTRALSRSLGGGPPTFTYLERFLQALAAKIAWMHVPFRMDDETRPVEAQYPEFLIERWATALQVGINSVPGLKRDVDVRLRPPESLLEEWAALGVEKEKETDRP